MRNSIIFATLALAGLLATVSVPAIAASAHNSQAGSMGPTSNPTGPTVGSPRRVHDRTRM